MIKLEMAPAMQALAEHVIREFVNQTWRQHRGEDHILHRVTLDRSYKQWLVTLHVSCMSRDVLEELQSHCQLQSINAYYHITMVSFVFGDHDAMALLERAEMLPEEEPAVA